MLKNKFLKFVTTLACIMTLILPHTSVVLAAALTNYVPMEKNEVNEVELSSYSFHDNWKRYLFGGLTPVIKIKKAVNKRPTNDGGYKYDYTSEDTLYCLNGRASFATSDGVLKYKREIEDFFDTANKEKIKETISVTDNHLSDDDYYALCGMFYNMYLKEQMNNEEKDAFLEKVFKSELEDTRLPRTTLQDIKDNLDSDDINVIQQWAVWYFTNRGQTTIEGVSYENTLPNIDVQVIDSSTGTFSDADSMQTSDSVRYEFCKTLYQYLINEASKTSGVTFPSIEKGQNDVKVEIDGANYKIGPFKVSKPSDGIECDITLTDGENKITSYDVKDANGNIIKDEDNNILSINKIFNKDYYIYLPINETTISNLQFNLFYKRIRASVWTAQKDPSDTKIYQPVVLLTNEPQNSSISIEIPKRADLALRKSIVKVNDTTIEDRNPNIDASKLNKLNNNELITTATYKHKKSAVEVKPGDKVTFRLSIYNEGDVNAKDIKITDYLPEGLTAKQEDNEGWKIDGNKATITVSDTINAFNKDIEKSTKYVDIVCEVSKDIKTKTTLTNIAEITEFKDENGNVLNDRDSTETLENKIDNLLKPDYTGKGNKTNLDDSNYYYKGQEDDDDFEKLLVKTFDLSLQKFITKINGKAVESREPVVDVAPLKNGQKDAKYTTKKEPKLKVQVGDIVTYTIRVYNEGDIDGYAETVADYLPEGLGYLIDYKADADWTYPENAETVKLSEIKNATKKLKVSDFNNIEKLDDVKVAKGSVKLETQKLKNSKINAFNNAELDYKDIEVTCIVLSDKNLKNIAEIVNDKDKDKKDIDDRDSTPDNYYKDGGPNKEDDDDYEELVTKIFDLSLQKFITKVNDKKVTDREPTYKYENGKFSYEHPTTPLQVKNGDKVTYTLRVYNEGPTSGYAAEIGDNIPAGLKFEPEDETNKKYGWKMYDSDKKETTDVSKAVEIRTDYLSKAKAEERKETTLLEAFNETTEKISSKDIQVVFTVNTNSFDKAIINIAEITKNTDEDGEDITDIDSTPDNGDDHEDDLDKERVIVKPFDLSLQKFITKINGKAVTTSREPKVDTAPLKNGKTDATYKTVKNPLMVQMGDIVTYTIRVYNEGEVSGYAEQVADYLPEGLGYLVNYTKNIDNYWALPTDLSSDNTVKLSTIKNGTNNLKTTDFTGVTDLANVDVVKGSVKLTSTALNSSKTDNLLKAYDGSDKLSYKDIEVTCIVISDSNLKNIAEVTKNLDEDKQPINDRDSTPDNYYKDGGPNKEDDDDYETLATENKVFDLSLQKFITAVNGKNVTGREPKISYENGKLSYSHTATPLEVNTGDKITYSIRVYNEGTINGYAAEIGDDIPNGLTFDPNDETNKKYGWKMYDSNKKETTDVSKAVEIRTDYLSKEKSEARKENGLLKAFDLSTGNLFYLDVKAVFTVSVKSADSTVVNTAEITKDTDEDGKEIDDIDSTPDNKKDGEDDIDKEKIHVGYFDLSLQKNLTKAVITEDGSTKKIDATDGKLKKVEINRKKLNSTVVKFVYNITIKNEGTIPGYAKEITDYIPEGLEFVQEDNKSWKSGSNGTITTDALANTLIQPGQTASVEVVLRWINGENNLGLKTNVAEISKDYNEANDTDDVDSTPNNKKDGEDDIDNAPVILSISTGRAQLYLILSTAVLIIISAGVVMIKKYVLNK